MTGFRASGLASGIDSASMIEQLVALQKKPIESIQARSQAIDVQISELGKLKSSLTAFDDAVTSLASNGARGVAVGRAPDVADVTVTSQAVVGSFAIEVTSLATAAKARSAGQTPGLALAAGTLHIDADGTGYDVAVTAGQTMRDVATAINALDAPLVASVVSDGTSEYLQIARTDAGHRIGQPATDALALSGDVATQLTLASIATAQNAVVKVDGLAFERRSNSVRDVIDGVTLSLRRTNVGAPQELVLSDAPSTTKENLQRLVDSYNAVLKAVQSELDIKAETDRSKTLGGDPTLRFLQARMQSLVSRQFGTGDVRSLADVGVKTQRDGSLTLDARVIDRALQLNPSAVDDLLGAGLDDAIGDVSAAFATDKTGALSVRQQGLADEKKRAEQRIADIERRAEVYKETLVAQFTAMEKIVSALNNTSTFLNNLDKKSSSSSSS